VDPIHDETTRGREACLSFAYADQLSRINDFVSYRLQEAVASHERDGVQGFMAKYVVVTGG
jgi:hypothetical protein